jgi:hypothetical protein
MTLDEILLENEKLRVELSACNHVMLKHLAYIDELEAEIDKLRPMTVIQESLIRKAEAESERLRAALEPFARLYLWPFDHHLAEEIMADADWCEEENDVTEEELFICRKYIRAARTALSGDKQ